jgi:hypothetical protein
MHSHPQLRMPHAVAQRSVATGVVSVSVTLAVELNGTDLSARFQSREARRLTDVYETGAAMHPVCSKSIATQPVRRGGQAHGRAGVDGTMLCSRPGSAAAAD